MWLAFRKHSFHLIRDAALEEAIAEIEELKSENSAMKAKLRGEFPQGRESQELRDITDVSLPILMLW